MEKKKKTNKMRQKVLHLLRGAGEKYISGAQIAERLGVSRTAVWKHIRELQTEGYEIVSQLHHGYRLQEVPDRLLPGEIQNGLQTQRFGKDVVYYDEVVSTNTAAKRLAAEGAHEGTIVISETQLGGRGRMDRSFFSPKGKGIWCSLILRPPFLPQDAPKCTLLAATALVLAMADFHLTAGIKWPNDIMAGGKKLVGILTEMSAEMDKINYLVVGMGINVNILPEDFPAELQDKATSLAILQGECLSRVKFLQAVLERLEQLYEIVLRTESFAEVLNLWRKYSLTLGNQVSVIGPKETFQGEALDIDADGALLVQTEHGIRRVLAGDVSIRPVQQ